MVRQPWASLIALGHKTIETRPGPPNGPMRPQGVRGLPGCRIEQGERIAIVAGASRPKEGLRLGLDGQVTDQEFLVDGGLLLELCNERSWPLPLGVVLATVEVEFAAPVRGKVPANDDRPAFLLDGEYGDQLLTLWHAEAKVWPWQGPVASHWEHQADQLPLGDFTLGRWGWLLTDVHRTEPIPCKGRQGVFELPADVAERLL